MEPTDFDRSSISDASRLTALETNYANLNTKVDHVQEGMTRIENKLGHVGKTNWGMLAVMSATFFGFLSVIVVPAITAICIVGLFGFNVLDAKADNNDALTRERIEANSAMIVKLDERMTRGIEAQDNRLTRMIERFAESALHAVREVDARLSHAQEKTDDRLTKMIVDEQQRNNQMQKEISDATAIDNAFKAGVLDVGRKKE